MEIDRQSTKITLNEEEILSFVEEVIRDDPQYHIPDVDIMEIDSIRWNSRKTGIEILVKETT